MEKLLTLAILFLLCVGCAHTSYAPFDGGSAIVGTGGTKEIVDGMEVWQHGTPPRQFKIIGIIDDRRRNSRIGMIGYESSLVKSARSQGGDAVILSEVHRELTGMTFDGDGNGTAIRDRYTTAQVIKYIP